MKIRSLSYFKNVKATTNNCIILNKQHLKLPLFVLLIITCANVQKPPIKWWFDTKDTSFGQSEAVIVIEEDFI